MKIRLIHDGDHGGDDFITTLMILNNPDRFELLGITTGFGNVSVRTAAENALRAVEMAGSPDIPVFIGAAAPLLAAAREGDDAFGGDGLGGVNLPPPRGRPQDMPAIEWMIRQLEETATPITFCVTGPATNMALLLRHIDGQARHLKEKIGAIVMMGGGLAIGGNIQPYAEFNFYMDPDAADYVLASGCDIVLHTLDTTHSIVFHPARQQDVAALPGTGPLFRTMIRAVEHLDMEKFGAEGAYMNDEHTVCWLIDNGLYETKETVLRVNTDEKPGNLFIADSGPAVRLVTRSKNPDAGFAMIFEALEKVAGNLS